MGVFVDVVGVVGAVGACVHRQQRTCARDKHWRQNADDAVLMSLTSHSVDASLVETQTTNNG